MKKIPIILAAILILFVSCAKPPTEEMNKAIETLIRAENDPDALIYAGNTLNRARESLLRMQEEAGSKRYETAKTYAADVIIYAERAVNEGRANAARARDEAAGLLDSLRIPLTETESILNTARTNNIQLDFNDLETSLDSARNSYEDAKSSLSANDFEDAINRGQSARSALSAVNAEINEAAQALSGKK